MKRKPKKPVIPFILGTLTPRLFRIGPSRPSVLTQRTRPITEADRKYLRIPARPHVETPGTLGMYGRRQRVRAFVRAYHKQRGGAAA